MKDIVALGLAPNFKKTMGVPGRRVKFLGFILDSMEMHMYVLDTRLQKLEEVAKEMLERATDASVRELASVAGKVVSMVPAIPAAMMMTKECYKLVRPEGGDWDAEVKITQEVRDELMEIVKMIRVWNK